MTDEELDLFDRLMTRTLEQLLFARSCASRDKLEECLLVHPDLKWHLRLWPSLTLAADNLKYRASLLPDDMAEEDDADRYQIVFWCSPLVSVQELWRPVEGDDPTHEGGKRSPCHSAPDRDKRDDN